MSRIARLIACVVGLSALTVALGPGSVLAKDEALFLRPEDHRFVLFAGADGGRSVFLSGGSKQALTGTLDRPGLLGLELTGIGLTHERIVIDGRAVAVRRFTHQTSASLGWQTMLGPLYLAAYAGPELFQEQLTHRGRFANFSKPRLGGRAQVELWAHPSPDTLITGTVILSSANESVWARMSGGIRAFSNAYLGPEVTFYTTPTYRETRWGGHVTGLALGIVTLRLSAGWMTEDGRRSLTPYASISAWMRL
ncbi:cellulose biosynthesis protein BcsS [Enterovirga rhinocerotis]|uniref:Cellulose biosynthesis protein BcsS n=1 Tax=Enterovirga rhinocerotis TaxID=1339210 RepID=A0A4R7C8X2_9HYPH|nr:cellulose biosynthesis protein BcsS [Enterovirga rhinocerotis]TDR94723.1 cellulose biosynthesis protein BcsS [Enterovirga rhinocerotis]